MKSSILLGLVATATANVANVRTTAHSSTHGTTCSDTTCAWDATNGHVVVTHPGTNDDTIWQSSSETQGIYAHCGLVVGTTNCECLCHSDLAQLPAVVAGGAAHVMESTDFDKEYDQSDQENHAATVNGLDNDVTGDYDQGIDQHTGMSTNTADNSGYTQAPWTAPTTVAPATAAPVTAAPIVPSAGVCTAVVAAAAAPEGTCVGGSGGCTIADNLSNFNDKFDASEICAGSAIAPDYVIKYSNPTSSPINFKVDTCDASTTFDITLAVYTVNGGACAQIACNDDGADPLLGSCANNGVAAFINHDEVAAVPANSDVYVVVSAYSATGGSFKVHIVEV